MLENKKIVVIYRSKSGFTKEYADWITEELKCDQFEASNIKLSDLSGYDVIIYGGGIYAAGINGVKLITKNYEALKTKQLIVFAVGSTPVRDETTQELCKMNIPAQQQDHIQFFYLRGGFDYSKLSPFNKFLMSLLKIKLKRVKNPNADERGLLNCYTNPQNFAKKSKIQPIIDAIS